MDDYFQWKKGLDDTINTLSREIKEDLYDNVVLGVVRDWFSCSDSLNSLHESIKETLNDYFPLVQRKIESAFLEFEETLKTELQRFHHTSPSVNLGLKEAEDQISATVKNIVDSVNPLLSGMIMGSFRFALMETGPVGWIIGAILGLGVFFLGKKKIKDLLNEPGLRNLKIPAFLKKPSLSKIGKELKLKAPKFEQDIYQSLKTQCTPLYMTLKKLSVNSNEQIF